MGGSYLKNNLKNKSSTIRAFLSNQQLKKLANKEYSIVVPYGVQMHHSKGSKWLTFHCANEKLTILMEEALDGDSILWQKS